MPEVTTYYLEMTSPDALRASADNRELTVTETEIKDYTFNRYLYRTIGKQWQWIDRMVWTDRQWQQAIENDQLRTWVAYCRGTPAGYYELHRQDDEVEINYFGLMPGFIGQGFGGHLLTHAIRSAWDWPGTQRVWVHTCSLDHPTALANYQARGLSVYRTEVTPG